MNIAPACVDCIINQAERVGKTLNLDQKTTETLVQTARNMSKNFSFSKTPPEVAEPVYEKIAEILHTEDIYAKIKEHSMQKALSFLPFLKNQLEKEQEKFVTALKIAVAGNVIDLASEVMFDLEKELEKIFHTEFSVDDHLYLHRLLVKASKIVILGDNVGEHVFDKIFIETLKELFPNLHVYYFVRGRPIINDVTLKEAKEIGLDEVCEVIDSGVPTPGFVYEKATREAQELFKEADVVISKGMGNYECLSPSFKSPIAFLLKVKCNVVAASLGKELGDIICKVV